MNGWRVAVLTGTRTLGAGFAISASTAVTCAHVVHGLRSIQVQPFGGADAWLASVDEAAAYRGGDPTADVATLRLPADALPAVAPLGPLARPTDGTIVSLLGLPAGGAREGRWADGVVMGSDRSGRLLQIDSVTAHSTWVDEGFSGGPAVDRATGLVVGMVVGTGRERGARNAWLLPLTTLAEHLPLLRDRGGDPLAADADFRAFHTALRERRYADAIARLSAVQHRHPRSSNVYFYWALAALAGHRPAEHAGETIDAVIRLLCEAARLDPGAPHIALLAELVAEDYFVLRHLPAPRLPAECRAGPGPMDATHAREILDHVPAADCAAWRGLTDRSTR